MMPISRYRRRLPEFEACRWGVQAEHKDTMDKLASMGVDVLVDTAGPFVDLTEGRPPRRAAVVLRLRAITETEQDLIVFPGDWIVRDEAGAFEILPHNEFVGAFEPVAAR